MLITRAESLGHHGAEAVSSLKYENLLRIVLVEISQTTINAYGPYVPRAALAHVIGLYRWLAFENACFFGVFYRSWRKRGYRIWVHPNRIEIKAG